MILVQITVWLDYKWNEKNPDVKVLLDTKQKIKDNLLSYCQSLNPHMLPVVIELCVTGLGMAFWFPAEKNGLEIVVCWHPPSILIF